MGKRSSLEVPESEWELYLSKTPFHISIIPKCLNVLHTFVIKVIFTKRPTQYDNFKILLREGFKYTRLYTCVRCLNSCTEKMYKVSLCVLGLPAGVV